MSDVVEILQELIRCPSVTPADAGAQVYLSTYLKQLGFECHHLEFNGVPNLFARLGKKGPHICFGGHTDVVPPGPEESWMHGPFSGTIDKGRIYGRGASDMKGAVAAFAAACAAYTGKHGAPDGSISLLITGDEEGPAVDGTVRVLEWMKQNGHLPDAALVGEPSNPEHLGQEIKIGRRGSLTALLSVKGKQGHVAYQHMADNPMPRLVKMLDALASYKFDEGTEFFQPTNLEITSIDVGNKAGNVIPETGSARFNVRFNDLWTAKTLEAKIREILNSVHKGYALELEHYNAESFITPTGEWTSLVKKAVEEVTGKTPAYTTNGGTSDARFFVAHCPVVEFGGVNDTIHQVNENTEVAVLEGLTKVYTRILELYFA